MALVVRCAKSWHERLRGLLGTPEPGVDEALCIAPCNSIHTCGMGYPIDVLFVSHQGHALRRVRGLCPWRFALCPGAAAVFELRAGALQRHEPALLAWWQQCSR